MDHDEHQFIASGALLTREGLLPYRDYAYFHTPYLSVVYAAIFRFSDHLLLSARLFSVACSVAVLVLVGRTILNATVQFRGHGHRWISALAVLVLVATPLFSATTGRAWNHDFSELLLLISALLFVKNLRKDSSSGRRSLFAVGLLLGLSIGVRLTVAPAIAAFAGMILADTRVCWSRRIKRVTLFFLSISVGLIPLAWLAISSPQGFWFGNFQYPVLNTAWRLAENRSNSVAPVGKVLFLSREVFLVPGNALLVLAMASLLLAVRRCGLKDHPFRREMTFLSVLVLFLLVGSFAPAPMFVMYFFAPIPFLILISALAVAPFTVQGRDEQNNHAVLKTLSRPFSIVALFAAIATVISGIGAYYHLGVVVNAAEWIPLKVHRTGLQLAARVSPSKMAAPVLTLAPIYPLEGKLQIYEQFATGPFAMRVAPMIAESDEHALGLLDEEDLVELVKIRPPAAVLAGAEGALEKPLLRISREGRIAVVWIHKNEGDDHWLTVTEMK